MDYSGAKVKLQQQLQELKKFVESSSSSHLQLPFTPFIFCQKHVKGSRSK